MNKVDGIFLSCVRTHRSDLKSNICFVGMNKSTVYLSLAFIHVVRMSVVALSLHLSRGVCVCVCIV